MVLRPKIKVPRQKLVIEYVATDKIRPRANNPRRHPEAQIGMLMEAIREFGFVVPILVGPNNEIIAGHGRWDAAKRLGLKVVPIICLRGLSPARIRALVIADNQLAALSKWDDAVLKGEITALVLDETIEFSPTIIGFEAAEIDAIVFGSDFGEPDPADAVPAQAPGATPITQVGDVWRAKGLNLVCGDALSGEAYQSALGGECAHMGLTDPPYNVRVQGHVSGKGKVRHREFVQASGEMSEAEFIGFLKTACTCLREHVNPGALLYVFMDGAHLFELLSAARNAGLAQKALCTWAKTSPGMGSLYRGQTEHIVVFKSGEAAHTNNIQLGRFGRNRSTLWTYPGASGFGRDRDAALALHPTVKPVGLLADAILDATRRGELVLDPFAGSGSTLIAAHRVGRRCAGIELDPLYVDGALARIAAVTGLDFVRERDGALWSELRLKAQEALP